ncbi:unnamed protein product [Chrysoparadoxa australica]
MGCDIHGHDIGHCDSTLLDDETRELIMPFCGPYVRYTPCVPKLNAIGPSRDHPDGRWFNNTVAHKDAWVQQYHEKEVQERIEIERGPLRGGAIDEFGEKTGAPFERFYENQECSDAFRNYLCWSNFPRCDDEGKSLAMCTSVCENYMMACRYPRDMWRCGPTEFFNGDEPEKITKDKPTYLRDFFPGQPFVPNLFAKDRRKTPIPVCTPSTNGSSSARASWRVAFAAASVALAALWLS